MLILLFLCIEIQIISFRQFNYHSKNSVILKYNRHQAKYKKHSKKYTSRYKTLEKYILAHSINRDNIC